MERTTFTMRENLTDGLAIVVGSGFSGHLILDPHILRMGELFGGMVVALLTIILLSLRIYILYRDKIKTK